MINNILVKSGLVNDILNVKVFTLNDDLTYLIGGNGSGKSILFNSIAHYCFIDEVGGFKKPMFIKSTLDEYYNKCRTGLVKLDWDGAEVFLLSNKEMHNHHLNLGYEMGSGKRIPQLGRYMDKLKQAPSEGMLNKLYFDDLKNIKLSDNVNKLCEKSYYDPKEFRELFDGFKGGKTTLLLDEIDSGLSLEKQYWFHRIFLPELSKKHQVFCISHSIFVNENEAIHLDDSFETLKNKINYDNN